MTYAPAHDQGPSQPKIKPPRPAATVTRRHRARTEEEALERFRAAATKRRREGLYPIAMSWSNGEVTGRKDEVELAVTYLRRP